MEQWLPWMFLASAGAFWAWQRLSHSPLLSKSRSMLHDDLLAETKDAAREQKKPKKKRTAKASDPVEQSPSVPLFEQALLDKETMSAQDSTGVDSSTVESNGSRAASKKKKKKPKQQQDKVGEKEKSAGSMKSIDHVAVNKSDSEDEVDNRPTVLVLKSFAKPPPEEDEWITPKSKFPLLKACQY